MTDAMEHREHEARTTNPLKNPRRRCHLWTGEKVTTPYDGHPEVRTQEGHRRDCNKERTLELKDENHHEK